MNCPACGGEGFITVKDEHGDKVDVPCPRCDATGDVTEKPCEACGGKGEITIMASDGTPRIISCPSCSGEGIIKAFDPDNY
jgi:DnaJ-class molecular chaperone